jgi:hypothetical protein
LRLFAPNYAYYRPFSEKKDCLFFWKAGARRDGELTLAAKLTQKQTKSRPKPTKK